MPAMRLIDVQCWTSGSNTMISAEYKNALLHNTSEREALQVTPELRALITMEAAWHRVPEAPVELPST